MCDVAKAWAAFSSEHWFEALFPEPAMQEVVRQEVISKMPDFLADHLDKPVTVDSLLECWLAYTTHYLSAGVYGKIVAATPVGVNDKSADPEEVRKDIIAGEQLLAPGLVNLSTVVQARKFPAIRPVAEVEHRADQMLRYLLAFGIAPGSVTIRDLAETRPMVLLQLGT